MVAGPVNKVSKDGMAHEAGQDCPPNFHPFYNTTAPGQPAEKAADSE
jgi:hypothetical protein